MTEKTLQRRLLAAAREMVLASNYVPAAGENVMKHEHWYRWVDAHIRLEKSVNEMRRFLQVKP